MPTVIVAAAWWLAFQLRFDHGVPIYYRTLFERTVIPVVVINLVVFLTFGFYNRWWRYVSIRDMWQIVRGVVVACLIAAALLVPVLFRRQRRRAGLRAGALTPRFRRRLIATMVLSVLLLSVGLAGAAYADNGDPNGSKTGISQEQVNTVFPSKTPEKDSVSVITHQQAKDHLAINYSWLMVGGVLYTITGLWAALEGSILLWSVILGGYLTFVAFKFRKREQDSIVAVAIITGLVVALFFSALMLGPANPFRELATVPFDGRGPNPLLQNHVLMAFHPPILYLGYVGFTVPFMFGIFALIFATGFTTSNISVIGGLVASHHVSTGLVTAADVTAEAAKYDTRPLVAAELSVHIRRVFEQPGNFALFTPISHSAGSLHAATPHGAAKA